jgi:hypothetical protein
MPVILAESRDCWLTLMDPFLTGDRPVQPAA